jgi:hypothetical protein
MVRTTPVYLFWHGHIGELIAAQRPDLDAPLLADLLLAGRHAEPILRLLERGETARLAVGLRLLAAGILD